MRGGDCVNEKFTLIVIDGHFADFFDLSTDSVKFEGLTWEESVQLAKISFRNGHEVVIWKQELGADEL